MPKTKPAIDHGEALTGHLMREIMAFDRAHGIGGIAPTLGALLTIVITIINQAPTDKTRRAITRETISSVLTCADIDRTALIEELLAEIALRDVAGTA